VDNAEVLGLLFDLAAEAGLEVRSVGLRSAPAGELPPASAVCRVKDAVWVVLSAADPAEAQISVLAAALRDHRPDWLEQHFIPPAVRSLL
jgi:acetyl esterase/lipase